MLRVISHIEQLLEVHDCVIVPGIGGFVSQTVHAVYNSESHLFIPMHREVIFNGSLQHNDGLLTESYMKAYQVDFSEARQMAESDVEYLQAYLQQHTSIRIGHIGKLVLSDSGQLIFETGVNELHLPETYGLAVLQVKTVQDLQKEEVARLTALQKQDKNTIYIPIRRRVLHGISATAAAIALFFLVSTSVDDIDKTGYQQAGLTFPAGTTSKEIPLEDVNPDIIDEIEVEVIAEVVQEPVVEEVPVVQPVVTNKKMYHIIIGSFVTDKQADEFIAKIDPSDCPRMNKITRDERIRVYADKFDNRADAENYLEALRQNQHYQDAWLFISR